MQGDYNALMAAAVDYLVAPDTNRRNDSSATWTTSTGDIGVFSDSEEIDDRAAFVDEYNRLAKKHRIRLLVKEDLESCPDADRAVSQERKSSWFRTLLREFSSSSHHSHINTRHSTHRRASDTGSIRKVSSKRSLSDIAAHLLHPKKDSFKDEDLQTLVRLCGKSKFYLPSDYAPASLVLPTCFRATAQYLVQHGTETRGIFRHPGSAKVVNAIYHHYCPTQDEADITDTTVSSPNLPAHFKASVHDVASAFKRFLAGLPGGILGSLALFDAFVAIYSQVYGATELNRTKQSKLRARLFALAIGTLKSQYRRDLICAVFGLLSLIGRAAETAPREDERGRPLPTSDLMGYNALGAAFGPLLVGNLLDSYTMKLANPSKGLILLPLSPPKSRKNQRPRNSKTADEFHPPPIAVDKIRIASDIAEVVITNWREVVKNLKSLGALKTQHKEPTVAEQSQSLQKQLRPTASETFDTRQAAEWRQPRPASVYADSPLERRPSYPGSQYPGPHIETHPESLPVFSVVPEPGGGYSQSINPHEPLSIKRRRPKSGLNTANDRLLDKTSRAVLSPAAEESASPFPQDMGGPDQSVPPSVDTSLTLADQAPPRDVRDYGILLQTATPISKADPSTPSAIRRQKASKPSFSRAKKLESEKRSQHAQRVRQDTPAPTLSGHDSARTREQDKNPSGNGPLNADENGIHTQIPGNRASSAVDVTDLSDEKHVRGRAADINQDSVNAWKHVDRPHKHDVHLEPTASIMDQTEKQQFESGTVGGLDTRFEHGIQTTFIHPGEFPETPARPEDVPLSPFIHPGAFPVSPSEEEGPAPLRGGNITGEISGYPFKPAAEEASSLTKKDELPAIHADKATSTLGRSFRATLDDASNSLVRGVSSAASALAEVFNSPPSGVTSPTKIPGPHGSPRWNSRPSKHRRLQKRQNLDIFKTSSANDESAQLSSRDTKGDEDNPVPPASAVPNDDGNAVLSSGLSNIRAGLESLTRDLSVTHQEPEVDVRPADDNRATWQPTGHSTVSDENNAAQTSVQAENTEVGGPKPRNDDSFASHENDLASQSSARYPITSYFPSNDGNQSSATADTARDHTRSTAAGDQDEKVLPSIGDLDCNTMQRGLGVGQYNGDTEANMDQLRGWHQNEKAQTESNKPLDAGSSESQGRVTDDCNNPNHHVDAFPQRSVRRLSHIFKRVRRSSPTAATPSSTPARRTSYISTTPAHKHIRRSSTSAGSSSQAPIPDDPKLLGPGRMTPYQDLPPVASHIVRRLPPRSATPSMETLPARTVTPSGGSNAALYNQVLTLQRQLAARTEEVAHLSRQLEAIGEGGAGTLSERLRVAEREARMWKERALAAERRVVVFERFLARVRQLRQKRAGADKAEGGGTASIELEIEREMDVLHGVTENRDGEVISQFDGGVWVPGAPGKDGLRVWLAAAREVIEYDDERRWMSGGYTAGT